MLQVVSAFPYFVAKSLALKPFFIIGYLHLFTLAFMSVLLFLLLIQLKNIKVQSKSSKIGMVSFLGGILCTELIMFFQGGLLLLKFSALPHYHMLLLIFSFLIVLGASTVFVNQFIQSTYRIK